MHAGRAGHGWGAYFWPYLSFLVILEIAGRFGAGAAAIFLPLKVAIPLLLFAGYFARGRYPELRGARITAAGAALDVAVGVAGAAAWMAPYLMFDSLRPENATGFDPDLYGPDLAWLALGLRAIGYGVATPFIEELFVRSWLARYVDVFDRRADFRDVPLARYSLRSFVVVVVWFTFSHVPWEWPVAAVWIFFTQLWFYHRRNLVSMVIVHAASNLSILFCVVFASGALRDGQGLPLDLWFFV